MKKSAAEIVREYGPFPGIDQVNGVTFDGERIWFASGDKLNALDPASGKTVRSLDMPAHAGTAFDGRHLFQIAADRIPIDHCIDQRDGDSGIAGQFGNGGFPQVGVERVSVGRTERAQARSVEFNCRRMSRRTCADHFNLSES